MSWVLELPHSKFNFFNYPMKRNKVNVEIKNLKITQKNNESSTFRGQIQLKVLYVTKHFTQH